MHVGPDCGGVLRSTQPDSGRLPTPVYAHMQCASRKAVPTFIGLCFALQVAGQQYAANIWPCSEFAVMYLFDPCMCDHCVCCSPCAAQSAAVRAWCCFLDQRDRVVCGVVDRCLACLPRPAGLVEGLFPRAAHAATQSFRHHIRRRQLPDHPHCIVPPLV